MCRRHGPRTGLNGRPTSRAPKKEGETVSGSGAYTLKGREYDRDFRIKIEMSLLKFFYDFYAKKLFFKYLY